MKLSTIALMACALFFAGTGQAAAVDFTFNDLGSHQIYFEETTFVSEPLMPFEITNNTDFEWNDFHLALDGIGPTGGEYPYMRFTDLGGDDTIYSGPGVATFSDVNEDAQGYDEVMTIDGLSIPGGSSLSFGVDIAGGGAPEGLYSYWIWAMPSLGDGEIPSPDPQIPEPASMLLLGSGLAGLVIFRRRSRKK